MKKKGNKILNINERKQLEKVMGSPKPIKKKIKKGNNLEIEWEKNINY